MRLIELDAARWITLLDFYDDLAAALGSPSAHGRSVNAFSDSMIWGGMNSVEPPYSIRVNNRQALAGSLRAEVELLMNDLVEARRDHRERVGSDVEVFFEGV